ncbi:MAG: nitroreductase family protein [Bacteroidales bacterium]|nr:nitroreductase family protein [Bacteroidales bacterium]MDD4821482.1 nitroreductase family protein [Bacteroidales bacterium]
MLEILKNRGTVRNYSEKEVDETLLNNLLEASFQASTTGNMQLYSVVVTRDQAGKERLSPLHFNQPQIINAPVVLTFCADFNRFSLWCEQRNAVPGYANFQSFMTAAIDAIIVAQTFCVAAESKGLGICYMGTTTYTAAGIIDALNLPKLVVPVTTLTVGYPKVPPAHSDRLPLGSVIHYEKYQDYTPEAIDIAFSYKESLEESKRYMEINKKETLAQIFTDIRYTKANNETFSTAFMEVLKKQGFLS